ncbi:MAG: metalloregulator ArsR/SmtB family transcription factor [Natronospirillum sp.]
MTVQSPYEQWAHHLKATADPLRLVILRVLRQQSYGVLELSQILAIQQSRLSHHLKILTQAGLLAQRREGNSIFYQRHPAPDHWANTVFDTVDQWPLPDAIAAAQGAIATERQAMAEAFFSRHAHQFKARQDLIAEYPQYAEQARALLDEVPANRTHAVEVGPGMGEFLTLLQQRFQRVDAIDISREMLEKARKTARAPAPDQTVQFFHGDLNGWQQTYTLQADVLIYNMVLHHIPTPEAEIARTADALAPGGYLLVTDLCRHEQSWARDNCGDQWLGFDRTDLNQWATRAGFTLQNSSVSALRNGFQVQCLLWQKATPTALQQ